MSKDERIYRVIFVNQDQVFEIYAKHVYQSDMWGFLEVEEFVFGNRSELVIDPGEEKLKNQFAGVKRSYIPSHAIIRIDEVEQEGVPKVSDAKGTITAFPMTAAPKKIRRPHHYTTRSTCCIVPASPSSVMNKPVALT